MTGTVLTIDMTDPTCGSGITAAVKTIHALGGYALSAVSAVTVQQPGKLTSIHKMPAQLISDQIRAALASFSVDTILIGMLPGHEAIDAIGDILDGLQPRCPVILDPVINSRDGYHLLEKLDVDALKRRLLIHADLLMPNLQEAESLTGLHIRDPETMEHACEMLMTLGCKSVFLKGETIYENRIFDIFMDDRRVQVFEGERLNSKRVHGAGSTIAAAVAVSIAQRMDPREAVARARAYLDDAIRNAPDLGNELGPVGLSLR